jgi:hypothetical protein
LILFLKKKHRLFWKIIGKQVEMEELKKKGGGRASLHERYHIEVKGGNHLDKLSWCRAWLQGWLNMHLRLLSTTSVLASIISHESKRKTKKIVTITEKKVIVEETISFK